MKRMLCVSCLLLLPGGAVWAADAGTADVGAVPVTMDAGGDLSEGERLLQKKPAAPQTAEDMVGFFGQIVQAGRHGHWSLMIGLILMVLTRVFNLLLKQRVPTKVLPWIAISLALLTDGLLVKAYGGGWLTALLAGINSGLAAAGSYSAFGQYLPGMKTKR